MTWTPGQDRVRELLEAGELDLVIADDQVAYGLLDDARRHVVSASAVVESEDLSGAYQRPPSSNEAYWLHGNSAEGRQLSRSTKTSFGAGGYLDDLAHRDWADELVLARNAPLGHGTRPRSDKSR